VSAEWYQPLEPTQRFFGFAQAGYLRDRLDYFVLEQRVAEYRRGTTLLEAGLGLNFPLWGQLRLGWREANYDNSLETGIDLLSLLPQARRASGLMLGLDLDRSDSLYFPRRGWDVQAGWFLPEDRGYNRLSLQLRGAVPLGDWVLGGRLSWVDSPRGQLPISEAAGLGGFLNLSGYAKGQFLGDGVAYGHLRAERIIGRAPLGLRGDMRLGLALELGRVAQPYTVQRRDGLLGSVAIYLGGETPFGPVYLGLGQGDRRATNAYLFLGTP
jgi:NTE family protein